MGDLLTDEPSITCMSKKSRIEFMCRLVILEGAVLGLPETLFISYYVRERIESKGVFRQWRS